MFLLLSIVFGFMNISYAAGPSPIEFWCPGKLKAQKCVKEGRKILEDMDCELATNPDCTSVNASMNGPSVFCVVMTKNCSMIPKGRSACQSGSEIVKSNMNPLADFTRQICKTIKVRAGVRRTYRSLK